MAVFGVGSVGPFFGTSIFVWRRYHYVFLLFPHGDHFFEYLKGARIRIFKNYRALAPSSPLFSLEITSVSFGEPFRFGIFPTQIQML